MCLAVPARVLQVEDTEATVDLEGARLVVSTVLCPDVETDDFVLVHAGFAIGILDKEEALRSLEAFAALRSAATSEE